MVSVQVRIQMLLQEEGLEKEAYSNRDLFQADKVPKSYPSPSWGKMVSPKLMPWETVRRAPASAIRCVPLPGAQPPKGGVAAGKREPIFCAPWETFLSHCHAQRLTSFMAFLKLCRIFSEHFEQNSRIAHSTCYLGFLHKYPSWQWIP